MKMKTIILTGLVMILSAGVIFAATPTEIITDLTGLSETEVYDLHVSGKTYGQIAQEADVFEEYQELILKEKLALLEQRVTEGVYTKEQADLFATKLKEQQATCDPSSPSKIMAGTGFRFGGATSQGNGFGLKDGTGLHTGQGNRAGNGMGFRRNVNN